MKRSSCMLALALVASTLAWRSPAADAGSPWLWQIGKPDHGNAEFALAPNGYRQFTRDGFFIVGESDAARDWPYAQPGPNDSWAGGVPHTFTILFGLKAAPRGGECQLQFDLLDTQNQGPPKLRVEVNGRTFERSLAAGAGDASINGEPARGREQRFSLAFPSDLLRTGDNEILITTVSGSWLLYDWIGLATPAGVEPAPVQARTVVTDFHGVRALVEKAGRMFQPVSITLRHFGAPVGATVRVQDGPEKNLRLEPGAQTVELLAPAVPAPAKRTVWVQSGGQRLAGREVTLKPVRKLTVYILPHSHTDIGYTEIQTAIEKKQVDNLLQGIEYARKTAAYPAGARFVWNVEVLWAADLYLHRLNESQRAAFFAAVKQGQVVLNGMYLNELTGLCRPEELLELFREATKISARTGVKVDSAMISDVPGYTWGVVTAMAQAGIKYFSTAPNYFDRIGTILREWENKPFYWVGPDGRSRVLVWIPFWGYAMSHRYGQMSAQLVDDFSEGLDQRAYPYDIAYVRWSGHGDNAVPDPTICEFVRDWNAKYTWPRFVISGTSEAFRALEKRYGARLPKVRGDWTPYWEDGAGSSARETAMNRESSDRLAQAETLWALSEPRGFPAADFQRAWKNVLLYSEHTWGADVSVSDPECQKTREQWQIKRSYAEQADQQSRALLRQAIESAGPAGAAADAVDLLNTTSWPRTELVRLPGTLSAAGDRVLDDQGQAVPSQRLSGGELAFVARDVPPFAAKRFRITTGAPAVAATATVSGNLLDSGAVRVRLDERTGAIVELRARGLDANLADTGSGEALNDYRFLPGDKLADLKRNGPVQIRVKETGPLVASLRVESDAPGCRRLSREVLVVAGFDHVELSDLVDKERAAISARPGDWQYAQREGKESVNFAFPFRVPNGRVLLDVPFGLVRPEADQMPSACKNWFTVGRWADVANADFGVTWVTLDAPLVEVGGITANLLGSQTNPEVWRKHVEPTQRIYSWAMNNHWGTNYRAYQEGPNLFRFILRPHRRQSPADATRFATAFSQPLLPTRARGPVPARPRLTVANPAVVVTAMKPADDGRGVIVRLFGASGKTVRTDLAWSKPKPKSVYRSSTAEERGRPVSGAIEVPGSGLVTLRAEFE